MSDLLLRRASEPRPGADGLDDYDVIGMEREIVGRIFKATRFPNDLPWQWSLAYGASMSSFPASGRVSCT